MLWQMQDGILHMISGLMILKNPVGIFYKANVFQNSGVDWKDVKLSFSNATPWVAGDIPVLYPWFIDFYIPVPRMLERKSVRSGS